MNLNHNFLSLSLSLSFTPSSMAQSESQKKQRDKGKKRKRGKEDQNQEEEEDENGGQEEVLRRDPLKVFGRDIMLKILHNLDARSVALSLLVSRGWHGVASSDRLWSSKVSLFFVVFPPL